MDMKGQYNYSQPALVRSAEETELAARRFMLGVYNWMAAGLAFTAIVALGVASSQPAQEYLSQNSWLVITLMVVELLMVIFYSKIVMSVSPVAGTAMYLTYAGINGVVLSFIFQIYTASSIASTFFICSGTFAATSLIGYTTRRDLTGLGHFMFMGLIGLIIASVVNIFLRSPMIYWATTYIGVLIFVGLTAYDTQKLKNLGRARNMDDEHGSRFALIGALILYLDFVNLMLLLLRIFGGRRN